LTVTVTSAGATYCCSLNANAGIFPSDGPHWYVIEYHVTGPAITSAERPPAWLSLWLEIPRIAPALEAVICVCFGSQNREKAARYKQTVIPANKLCEIPANGRPKEARRYHGRHDHAQELEPLDERFDEPMQAEKVASQAASGHGWLGEFATSTVRKRSAACIWLKRCRMRAG
jgi:hypothetical protein